MSDCPKCGGTHFGEREGNCPLSADYVADKPWPKSKETLCPNCGITHPPCPPANLRERARNVIREIRKGQNLPGQGGLETLTDILLRWLTTESAPAAPVAVEPRREIEIIPTIWGTFRVVIGTIYSFAEEAEAATKYKALLRADSQRTEGAGQNGK